MNERSLADGFDTGGRRGHRQSPSTHRRVPTAVARLVTGADLNPDFPDRLVVMASCVHLFL